MEKRFILVLYLILCLVLLSFSYFRAENVEDKVVKVRENQASQEEVSFKKISFSIAPSAKSR